MNRWYHYVIILVICIGFSLVQCSNKTRFLDFDERGLVSQLRYSPHMQTMDTFVAYISNESHPQYQTQWYQWCRHLHQKHVLEPIFPLLKIGYTLLSFARNSTYAPLFIWCIMIPIKVSNSFETMIGISRLLMTVFYAISALSIALLLKKMINKGHAILVAITLFCFSLSNMVYASHLSSYTSGVLAQVIVIYLVIISSQCEKKIVSPVWFFGLFCSLLLSYQSVFFIPLAYGAVFFSDYKQKKIIVSYKKLKRYVASMMIAGVPIIPFAYIVNILSYKSGKLGVTFVSITELTNYWVMSIYYCFGGQFLEKIPLWQVYGITGLVTALMAAGLVYSFKSKDRVINAVGYYGSSAIMVLLSLRTIGMIGNGYSRHSLIMLPLWVILVAFGICWISQYLKPLLMQGLTLLIVVIIVSQALIVFPAYKKSLTTIWNEDQLNHIINDHNIDVIMVTHDYYFPIVHFPSLFETWITKTSYVLDSKQTAYQKHRQQLTQRSLEKGDRLLYLSAQRPVNEIWFQQLKTYFNVKADVDTWHIMPIIQKEYTRLSVRGLGHSKLAAYMTVITL